MAWNGSDFVKISGQSGSGTFSSITNTGLTSGRVVYSTTGGLETDSANLTFDGTTLSAGGLSTTGASTLVKLVKVGDSSFTLPAVLSATAPAKLYVSTATVTGKPALVAVPVVLQPLTIAPLNFVWDICFANFGLEFPS